ncbi:MAG: MHS family MFS transporter [Pseudonocardia sp.]|uniref:MFS transporter n=1 Tax=unclassified Pseudonocardia TaxID=2619320 RepID=UPI00086E0201|nr:MULTISPECIES: MFS transporter [unclassified Pseudonocardia]MBN9108659.1 MHS family MFS transporter [Pseudonocardia sp.]ODV07708.1 MAG: MFS transporter [Pseudonocardia sp. SCN 73-27]
MATPAEPTTAGTQERPPMRRVAASVLIGTTIEWYDFQLYGAAAALVFAPLYFPNVDPLAGTLLAFSTFAIGFGARPLGGIVFGHFGDRIGRKKVLVMSLTMMGVATFLIGLLPTYASIGIWAPILLVVLRLFQGFGVGGEWGGAVLTAVEYSSKGKRGLYGSLPQIGVPAGLLLSTLAFLAVSGLPDDQFRSWGWRIPFLISIVLVGIGLFIRLKLTETPVFEKVRETRTEARVPLWLAIRTYPLQILLAIGSIVSTGSYFYIVNTYALSYGPSAKTFSRNEMLVAILISAAVAAAALPVFGAMSERFGRKRMILAGLAAMAIWIYPTMLAVDSGNLGLLIAAYLVGAIFFSISYGPQATYIVEMFDARVRFSAASTSFQIGVLLGGALAPIIAAALVKATGTVLSVAVYVCVMSLISLVCVWAISAKTIARGSADLDDPSVATTDLEKQQG